MEPTCNIQTDDFQRQVQALLCLRSFEHLCEEAEGRFIIVPLKGIDLLRSLYADTLDRELRDIDLLIHPAEKALEMVELLQQEGYRPEFDFALDKAAFLEKKKISMIPPSPKKIHVDVHMALITKRFFSDTIGTFNKDALSRLIKQNEVVYVLDDVDRWLFLAAHLAFHFLAGDKWYSDLDLLAKQFSEKQFQTLISRTKQYHLERVVAAVCDRLYNQFSNITDHIPLSIILPEASGKRFLQYIRYMELYPERLGHGLHPARYYWEFLFISQRRQRCRAFLQLLFPSLGMMQNMYRCHAFTAIWMYLPHVLMNMLGILLFNIQYMVISNTR